jgi:HK97 gp10 family phage protein
MEDIKFELKGLEDLKKNIAFYKALFPKASSRALMKTGFKVEGYAKQMCAVDTGRLRGSISTNWAGSGQPEGKTDKKAQPGDGMPQPPGEAGMVVAVGTNVFYGPYVEFGTSKMEARPYLFPAYFAYETELIPEIISEAKKGIK